MPLEIQINAQNVDAAIPTLSVELTGSLDTTTAPELEGRLGPLLDGEVRTVVFDLKNLSFISSAGLRVFAMVRKRMKERGGETAMVNMQPQIEQVFEIVQALPGVAVFANMEEFDRYLAKRQQAIRDNQI